MLEIKCAGHKLWAGHKYVDISFKLFSLQSIIFRQTGEERKNLRMCSLKTSNIYAPKYQTLKIVHKLCKHSYVQFYEFPTQRFLIAGGRTDSRKAGTVKLLDGILQFPFS